MTAPRGRRNDLTSFSSGPPLCPESDGDSTFHGCEVGARQSPHVHPSPFLRGGGGRFHRNRLRTALDMGGGWAVTVRRGLRRRLFRLPLDPKVGVDRHGRGKGRPRHGLFGRFVFHICDGSEPCMTFYWSRSTQTLPPDPEPLRLLSPFVQSVPPVSRGPLRVPYALYYCRPDHSCTRGPRPPPSRSSPLQSLRSVRCPCVPARHGPS